MRATLAAAGQWFYGQAHLLLALNMLFWAGNNILGRYVAGHVPPVALAWTRWMLALAILLPFAWPYLKRDLPLIRERLPFMIVVSVAGITAYNTMAYVGFQYTEAINGALMQSTAPLLIGLWTFVLFGDRLTVRQGVGILLSFLGIVIIVTRGDFAVLADLTLNIGDIWIVAALGFYAFYSALLRKRPAIHGLSFIVVTFALGNLFLTPFLLWEMSTGYVMTVDLMTVLSILYAALFASVFAYVFFNRGVELIGANQAGPFFHLIPAYGVVMAVLLLGERVALFHVAGIAAILAGIVLATRRGGGRIFSPPGPKSS